MNQLSLGVEPQSELMRLREHLGETWSNLVSAKDRSHDAKDRMSAGLAKFDHPDSSIVVFGSLARDEFTQGSDVDWTLLLDGQADPKHLDVTRAIDRQLAALGAKAPAPGGTFGRFAVSHDLLHRIGGEDDTNRNTTQRILLLLESEVLGNATAHTRVVHNVLRRYVEEDAVAGIPDPSIKVPRFLLNDIARYWHTLTVDFAQKRRVRDRKGWALRTAKLRMSRKLIYTAGLLSCYSCETDMSPSELEPAPARTARVVAHLAGLVRKVPLDIVAGVVLRYPPLSGPARELFGAYDSFLGILDDEDRRSRLEELKPDDAHADPLYAEIQEIGARFQDALIKIFFDSAETPLPSLTRRYGVF